MNDKKVVFIDMDGVLVNYQDYMQEHSSPKFEDMKPIEGSIDAFKELNKKFDVYIVSAPPLKCDNAHNSKVQWVRDHLGKEFEEKVILTRNKGLLIGDFLIDDNSKGHGQEKFRGKLIKFTDTWPDIIKNLKEIEEKILFDIDLPFFSYGIFQPKHFAYNTINDYVVNESPIEDSIYGDLWLKDGLLIVNNPGILNNEAPIPGYIIKFKKEFAKQAYDKINEIEPNAIYKVTYIETINKKIKANILISKENLVGIKEGDFNKGAILIRDNIKQRVECTSQNRVLKESIDEIDHQFKLLKHKNKRKDKIPYIVNLQMINLHLWGILERYTAFRYSLKMKPNERIKELSNDKMVIDIFNKIIDDLINKDYFIKLRDKKEDKIFEANSFKQGGRLNIENPSKFIQALYQIRCNITHRGKAPDSHDLARKFDLKGERDVELLRETTPILIDLTKKIVNN